MQAFPELVRLACGPFLSTRPWEGACVADQKQALLTTSAGGRVIHVGRGYLADPR